MKQFKIYFSLNILVIYCFISIAKSNPIIPKICNIKAKPDNLDLTMLNGEWYDLARTNYVYKEKTWKNGLTKINFNIELNELEIVYSGLDSSNNCETTVLKSKYSNDTNLIQFSHQESEESLEIIYKSDNLTIVTFCFEFLFEKNCPLDKLDLFVWSRNRNQMSHEDLKELLKNYCINNEQDFILSDNKETSCPKNDNENSVLIADLKVNSELFNSIGSKLVNSTNQTIFETSTISTSVLTTDYLIITETPITSSTTREIRFLAVDVDESSGDTEESFLDLPTSTSVISAIDLEIKLKKLNSSKNQAEISTSTIWSTLEEKLSTETTQNNITEQDTTSSTVQTTEHITSTESVEDEIENTFEISTETTTNVEETVEQVLEQTTTTEIIETTSSEIETVSDEPVIAETTKFDEIDSNESFEEIKTSTDLVEAEDKSKTLLKEKKESKEEDDEIENTNNLINHINSKQNEFENLTTSTNPTTESKINLEEFFPDEETSSENLKNDESEAINDNEKSEQDLKSDEEQIDIKNEDEKTSEEINEEIEQQEENTTEEEIITTTTTPVTTTTAYPCIELNCQVTHCNYGRKKDSNGCEICDCLTNPNSTTDECQQPYCHPCFYGSYTDENGCESCACKPRPKPKSIYECPKLECASCNYGSIKDEYGCETCICIRPNSLERSYPCPPEPSCPFGTCKYGSVLNDYGCATCDCLKSTEPYSNDCVRQRCINPCSNGYFTDENGCETCSCKPDWMAPCALSQNKCEITCEFGYYLDRNGCPSCECLPNPNLKTSCLEMREINRFTECDHEGYFKPKQCNEEECRCVSKDGMPISDFKANKSESEYMNCECATALYDISLYKAIGFKLYCASNGNYEIIQCVGGSCACVNKHGDPLGPSVPIYQKHLLRCEGVFQRVYYEKYLSTLPPTTLIPPLCVFHREKALEMSNIDLHLSIPECDEKGLYLPVQCDRQQKYCWCVNSHNGIELYGTRKVGERPNCLK